MSTGPSSTSTRSELKAALRQYKTISEIKSAGYDINDLVKAGYSASDLKEFGYRAPELKTCGITLLDLESAFSIIELRECFTINEMKAAGYNIIQLKAAGYKADEMETSGYKLKDLLTGGFFYEGYNVKSSTAASLKEAGCTAGDLRQYAKGIYATTLREAGYDLEDLKKAGFYKHEILSANYTLEELIPVWEKDEAVSACRCGQAFSLFIRRHHCRSCRKIFCYNCCTVQSKELAFLESGYHKGRYPQRVCAECNSAYN